MAKHPTEPLKCWKKAKELHEQHCLNRVDLFMETLSLKRDFTGA